LLGSACHVALCQVYFWRGRWEEAAKEVRKVTELATKGIFEGGEWSLEFGLKAYAGERDAALAMFGSKRGDLARPGERRTVGALAMLFTAVEGLAILHEKEGAAQLYSVVLENIPVDDAGLPTSTRPNVVAGMAASAAQQWDKAEEHYQNALRLAHKLPVVIAQPETRRWYAWMLLDRDAPGDREKASELLTEAIAMYRKIGMPKHVEMAERMLEGV